MPPLLNNSFLDVLHFELVWLLQAKRLKNQTLTAAVAEPAGVP
jgi:hypothetical protein